MIDVFTPKRIFPDCPFKSNQRPAKFFLILTRRYDAHGTPWSFLKIRISRRNRNRIRKYFTLFIMGSNHGKNRGGKSRDTLHCLQFQRCILKLKILCFDSEAYNVEFSSLQCSVLLF